MNSYQKEQFTALSQTIAFLDGLTNREKESLRNEIGNYLSFRNQVDQFLYEHCNGFCTYSCFSSRTSACCSKDGIITFWADAVINACCSNDGQLASLQLCITSPRYTDKCIYLGKKGCCWQVRPLVCAMFLCEFVEKELLRQGKSIQQKWIELKSEAASYRWPDRPVLFDLIEQQCIRSGIQSPLMYLNNSPGLLRVKKMAGLN